MFFIIGRFDCDMISVFVCSHVVDACKNTSRQRPIVYHTLIQLFGDRVASLMCWLYCLCCLLDVFE